MIIFRNLQIEREIKRNHESYQIINHLCLLKKLTKFFFFSNFSQTSYESIKLKFKAFKRQMNIYLNSSNQIIQKFCLFAIE